ncbi:uncharacterized protein LOC111614348 [Centruroides sculpturatus]|uniref:uncharacterized protein LOC111614348 n=1 Tax=Centruroides sculpturatus TaxID=218467 RepID=UPI000C6D4162|nr:uncharacterized protein LOC111614348 [Centruroides sculpturatus]
MSTERQQSLAKSFAGSQSAFLLSYSCQNSVKSATDIFVLLRKRIIRLTVPVFCLVAATIILPLLGDGPHWNDLLSDVHEIVENWPKYVFHYNNFIEYNAPNSLKLEHLWFLSALFQQILVAIPLLYINNRWPKYGKIIMVMLIVAGAVSHVINTNVYKDHTMFGYSMDYRKVVNYLNHNYWKPYYSHLSSFFTGFLFGCFLLKKGEIKFTRVRLEYYLYGTLHQSRNNEDITTIYTDYSRLLRALSKRNCGVQLQIYTCHIRKDIVLQQPI